MKKQLVLLNVLLVSLAFAVVFTGCDKDEDPVDMELVSLMAGESDLNGVFVPDDVSTDPTIVATFSADVDASTATTGNITMTRDYDETDVTITIAVSGATITITPASSLGSGTLYELSFNDSILSTDGIALTSFTRTFTTAGTFVPAGVLAHWTFENSPDDVIGSYDPLVTGVVAITYESSRNDAAGMAASFDGNTSIIEIPNGDGLIDTDDFTISFWVKTNSDHLNATGDPTGHFVLGLGAFYGIQFEMSGDYKSAKFAVQYELADGTTASEDMWFPVEATDNSTGGWKGWDFAKSVNEAAMVSMLKDTWLNVAYTFDAASKRATLYYNGEKMKSLDFNLWDDGDPKQGIVGLKYGGSTPDVVNELAFGFIQSRAGTMWDTEPWGGYDLPTANHFKGLLDDVRIFHTALSGGEVLNMYTSESAK